MPRGIWRHGTLKTFLTRGLLRSVGKPLFYTKADHIHEEFAYSISGQLRQMDRKVSHPSKSLIQYWLTLVPRQLFEDLFLPDEQGKVYLNVLEKAEQRNGQACAYFTQAFILWHIQQLLQNDEHFTEQMGFDMETLEAVTRIVLGDGNEVLRYLDYFRDRFDYNKPEAHPNEWSLAYVSGICFLVTKREQAYTEMTDDLLPFAARLELPVVWTESIIQFKKLALEIAEGGLKGT